MKKLITLILAWLFAGHVMAAVDINSADAKTISDALAGIGLKRAEAIVKYRTENGPFKSVDDLASVSGIGAKTVEKIKKDVVLDNSVAMAPVTESPAAPATPAPSAETAKPTKKK